MEISEIVQKMMEEGPVCDHCLGRQFSKLSTGLSNDERGHAIKLYMALEGFKKFNETGDDSQLKLLEESCVYAKQNTKNKQNAQNEQNTQNSQNEQETENKEESCWVCIDIFKNLDYWANRVVSLIKDIEFDTFLIGTKPTGLLKENEEIVWEICGSSYSEPLKSELNREIGKRVSKIIQKNVDFSNPDVTVIIDLAKDSIKVQLRSIYILGRYKKYVRGIPQTHWPCRKCKGSGCEICEGTGKQYQESVEELISKHLIPLTDAEGSAFHGAGREDIDALMLGSGRPFVIEAKSPRIRTIDLESFVEKVNTQSDGKIEISDIQFCEKAAIEQLKSEKADKTYRLKIKFDEPVSIEILNKLDVLNGAVISQHTPNRVVHRRADLLRTRKVHSVETESVDGNYAYVKVHCDGGLYVKELTSGDEGRTKPNISEIVGIKAKVEELDVIDVNI